MCHLSVRLSKGSPFPALCACAGLAQVQSNGSIQCGPGCSPLVTAMYGWREPFLAGVASCWVQLYEVNQGFLIRRFNNAFLSSDFSPRAPSCCPQSQPGSINFCWGPGCLCVQLCAFGGALIESCVSMIPFNLPETFPRDGPGKGLVKDVAYRVSDDLMIVPAYGFDILFNRFRGLHNLESCRVEVSPQQALELLDASFTSRTALNDVFGKHDHDRGEPSWRLRRR